MPYTESTFILNIMDFFFNCWSWIFYIGWGSFHMFGLICKNNVKYRAILCQSFKQIIIFTFKNIHFKIVITIWIYCNFIPQWNLKLSHNTGPLIAWKFDFFYNLIKNNCLFILFSTRIICQLSWCIKTGAGVI